MKARKTIPPAAAPVLLTDVMYGVYGLLNKNVRRKLEAEIKEYFETHFVFLVSSGKAALFLILSALKTGNSRKKVIIPAYTCYSVPSAVIKANLEIVPCDVLPDTLDYDLEQLETLADHNTLCIISTHLFGIPSDVERIKDLCTEKNIFLVEDGAQALGVVLRGKNLGTFGDVGFFSLGRGKNITSGSGGVIITASEDIASRIREYHGRLQKDSPAMVIKQILDILLICLFINPYLYWIPSGLPFLRIGETEYSTDFYVGDFNGLKAGLLFKWKEKLKIYNSSRSKAGCYYEGNIKQIRENQLYGHGTPYLRFPLYAESEGRKETLCKLFGYLGISPMYPDSVNNIPGLKDRLKNYNCRNAETIAQKLITLPTHTLVGRMDREKICKLMNDPQ